MSSPVDVSTALGIYLDLVDTHAPGLVEGLYVVGSYALDDWQPGRSDIDVVVVTAEPASDGDAGMLRTVHALLAEALPLPHIDGPYVAWGDLVVEPATGLHRPWVLDGTLHHDGDCFEINPVTWYTLANHGVTVRGPAAATLGIPTDTEARVRFVVQNLQTYWVAVADGIDAICALPEHDPFEAAALEWCVLGPLRLHFTAFTGGVTSKCGAGEYGREVAPSEFGPLLRDALAVRVGHGGTTASTDRMRETVALIRWVVDEATRAAG